MGNKKKNKREREREIYRLKSAQFAYMVYLIN